MFGQLRLKQNKTNKRTVLSKRAMITWANEIKCTGIIGIDFQHPPPEDPGYPTGNYVILWTNGARCTLNKEILDLLNEESISGTRSGRASLINGHQPRSHNPLLVHALCGVIKKGNKNKVRSPRATDVSGADGMPRGSQANKESKVE